MSNHHHLLFGGISNIKEEEEERQRRLFCVVGRHNFSPERVWNEKGEEAEREMCRSRGIIIFISLRASIPIPHSFNVFFFNNISLWWRKKPFCYDSFVWRNFFIFIFDSLARRCWLSRLLTIAFVSCVCIHVTYLVSSAIIMKGEYLKTFHSIGGNALKLLLELIDLFLSLISFSYSNFAREWGKKI